MDLTFMGVVYALGDPRTPERIGYVGETAVYLAQRYHQHVSEVGLPQRGRRERSNSVRVQWLTQLVKLGLSPSVMALELHGPGANPCLLRERETGWTAVLQARGEAWASPTLKPSVRPTRMLPELRRVRREIGYDTDVNPLFGGEVVHEAGARNGARQWRSPV
jgi:hypothetical protein